MCCTTRKHQSNTFQSHHSPDGQATIRCSIKATAKPLITLLLLLVPSGKATIAKIAPESCLYRSDDYPTSGLDLLHLCQIVELSGLSLFVYRDPNYRSHSLSALYLYTNTKNHNSTTTHFVRDQRIQIRMSSLEILRECHYHLSSIAHAY